MQRCAQANDVCLGFREERRRDLKTMIETERKREPLFRDRLAARFLTGSRSAWLALSHVPGMRAVTGHLGGLGHRQIALVVSRALGRPMRRRIEGFRNGLTALGVTVDDTLIAELPSAMSSSFDTVSRLLARRPRPTAIVVLGTNLLTDALNAIAVSGLRIPDDVSVVSLGDPDFARTYTPPITTLRIDVQQVAERVVTLLLDRVEHGERGPGRSVKVVPELIVRNSCAAPRADGAPSVSGKRTRSGKA